MKRYRLLKELPTFHAGDIFTLGEDGCLYLTEPCDFNHHWKPRVMAYHKNTLSSFPNILEDWFEEIKSKEYWCVDWTECGVFKTEHEDKMDDFNESIGNYFDTREEAEKAVEKLKAWKRLKDNGFKFESMDGLHYTIYYDEGKSYETHEQCEQAKLDLELLFGGEE